MPWYEATLDWLTKNIPWQIMFGIFVATSVVLFLAAPLGIDAWARPYHGVGIAAFVFSGSVLLANLVTLIGRPLVADVRCVFTRRHSRKHFHQMNPLEKSTEVVRRQRRDAPRRQSSERWAS
jgi:hypothetical protein